MSQGQALGWAVAYSVATELVERLADACERIEIAGSIRRRKGEVHDIEIVAISRRLSTVQQVGMFIEEVAEGPFALREHVADLVREGFLEPRQVVSHRRDGTEDTGERMGDAYKALVYQGMPVDLFITEDERWGCIFALRTGPHDWNIRLVQGCREHWRRVDDGRVLYHEQVVPTPEESDFFRALGVPWLEPQERRVDRLRFDRELLRTGVPA